jgi:hypothetical protein
VCEDGECVAVSEPEELPDLTINLWYDDGTPACMDPKIENIGAGPTPSGFSVRSTVQCYDGTSVSNVSECPQLDEGESIYLATEYLYGIWVGGCYSDPYSMNMCLADPLIYPHYEILRSFDEERYDNNSDQCE